MDQAVLDWFSVSPSEMPRLQEPETEFTPAVHPSPAAAIRRATHAERERLIEDHVCKEIGHVLHCPPESIDRHQTMTDLGIGSMIGLELQRRIAAALEVEPDLTFILRAANTATLAHYLDGLLTRS